MKYSIPTLAAIATLIATPAAFASAAETDTAPLPAATADTTALATPGTHYTLVDAHGDVVGELVSESASHLRLRIIGVANAPRRTIPAASTATSDRTFHPDYGTALTPAQMSAAWQAEVDRLIPQPLTGGG
ncbi:MAG: hypothetical protein JO103_00010 [Candidatus Eremiobacteraeota bacterium]|nr:hypothetical protein [Candidatus Eremiobacteraeota bacterium]MBV9408784.1 hypothetical protein [Candidatus Eremiobacteraeota bacterium]